jgi:hypothetical protein
MRKIGIIAVLSLLVTAFAAVPVLAQTSGAHFTRNGEPVCTITDSGGATASVDCTAQLAGLGNEDIISSTTVSGFAVYTCQNQGGNQAPGQNRVLEGPTTTPVTIPAGEIKNGRATVPGTSTLTAAPTVSGAAAGCPNNNWTGVNPEVTITSVTFSATQGGVLLFTSTASNPQGLTGTFSPTVTGGVAA